MKNEINEAQKSFLRFAGLHPNQNVQIRIIRSALKTTKEDFHDSNWNYFSGPDHAKSIWQQIHNLAS